jgi:hypothetical protein
VTRADGKSLFEISLQAFGIEWVVVFAYFDETGTSGGAERLTGVAGYLFDQAGVTKFRELYQAKVEPLIPPNDKGIRVFSASGVNAGRDHYHMPGRAKEAIFGAMVEALSETVIMGAVVAVTPEDYAEGIKGRYIRVRSSDPRDSIALRAGSKYSACLLRCIEQINTWLDLEKRDVDGGIEYTFESGCNHHEEAHRIMTRIEQVPYLKAKYRWRKFSFVSKGPDNPWLAGPDYFAWEWQRYDRNAMEPEHGEWRTTIVPLIEAKPHIAKYLDPASVNIQALINAFYGLRRPGDDEK